MMPSFKPDGYSTVSPYLIAAGAQSVIDFVTKAFSAVQLRRYEMPDGSIMHVEIRIGDSVVMLGDAGDAWPAVPSHLHMYVEDVDATYRRALEAGDFPIAQKEIPHAIELLARIENPSAFQNHWAQIHGSPPSIR